MRDRILFWERMQLFAVEGLAECQRIGDAWGIAWNTRSITYWQKKIDEARRLMPQPPLVFERRPRVAV